MREFRRKRYHRAPVTGVTVREGGGYPPGPLAGPRRGDDWGSAIVVEQWRALPVAAEPRASGSPGASVIRLDGRSGGVRRGGTREAADRAERIAAAHRGFLRRCVGYLSADLKIRQFIDFGSRLPHSEGVQAVAREYRADSRAVRVEITGAAPPLGRTALLQPAAVRIAGSDPGEFAARLGMRGLLDLAEPAAALLDTGLLPCDVVAHDLVRALHAVLAPGSHIAILQRPPNRADPYARDLAATLFEPFELLEPGLADLSWWPYPDEEAAAPGSGVLAGVARRG